MDLLKFSGKKSRLSNYIYVALNIGLAIALLFVVRAVDAPYAAILLVLMSKWRVFAVRPRFWTANILANIVDFIVSISVLVLLYAAMEVLWLQAAITVLYIIWLLFIKPRSKHSYITAQAGCAVFFGVTAIMTIAHSIDVALVVVMMWVVGYSAARHVLLGYEESHTQFFSFVWGLVFAEFGWLMYHWTIGYGVPGFGGVMLTQAAIITTSISFVAERAYLSRRQHEMVRASDVLLPIVFAVSITLILVLFFSSSIVI